MTLEPAIGGPRLCERHTGSAEEGRLSIEQRKIDDIAHTH